MYSVSTAPELLADLHEAGTAGIIEHDGWLEAFFEDAAMAARFGDPVPAENRDWVQATYDAWPPLLVGEKFFVVPPWCTEPAPPDGSVSRSIRVCSAAPVNIPAPGCASRRWSKSFVRETRFWM